MDIVQGLALPARGDRRQQLIYVKDRHPGEIEIVVPDSSAVLSVEETRHIIDCLVDAVDRVEDDVK